MITIPVKDLARYQTDYFAMSCWIYCDKTFSTEWQVAVGSWYDWTNSWFHLGFYGEETLHNQILISKRHQYQFNCHSKTKIQTKRWYHVVIQVSREEQEIYVDGKREGQVDMTNSNNRSEIWGHPISQEEKWEDMKMDTPHALCIGSKSSESSPRTFWYGQVADVCICTQWFHPKEIQAIYHSKVTIDKVNFGKFVLNSIAEKPLDQNEI
ncbi:unnamed protein product [Rotaria sp. Silwood1]|nr:unnamed protein product [Rotaria sp. Silwood1]